MGIGMMKNSDLALGVEQREERHHAHDRPGGADHRDDGDSPRADAASSRTQPSVLIDRRAQVEGQEVPAAVERLHLAADDPEEQHVPEEVPGSPWRKVAVSSSQSRKWPERVLGRSGEELAGEVVGRNPEQGHLEQEDDGVDEDDGLADRRDAVEPVGARRILPDNTRGRRCP